MISIEQNSYSENDFYSDIDGCKPQTVNDISEILSWGENIYQEPFLIQDERGISTIDATVTPEFVRFLDQEQSFAICGMNRIEYNSISHITANQIHAFPESPLRPEHKIVCLLFKTKQDGTYHPHLHAGKIFDAQFTYLLQHGPIDGVLGRWSQDQQYSTNYDAYQKSLNKLNDIDTLSEQQKKEHAAFSTWTGKKLQPFGFRRAFVIEKANRRYPEIFTLFTR